MTLQGGGSEMGEAENKTIILLAKDQYDILIIWLLLQDEKYKKEHHKQKLCWKRMTKPQKLIAPEIF